MRIFIMGDIHGEYNKLLECLRGVHFDYREDTLIQLGDVVDRGPKSFECVEELLKVKNLIAIKGNHDDCFYQGLIGGNYLLYNQGGRESVESYIENCNPARQFVVKMSGYSTDFGINDLPKAHQDFFKNQLHYYVDEENNCFVHGGFNRHYLLTEHEDAAVFWWDRDLLHAARSYNSMKDKTYPFKMKDGFKEVFIGHTPVQYFGESVPQQWANIWDLDTGSGKGGVLTIMDLSTKEYFQSK